MCLVREKNGMCVCEMSFQCVFFSVFSKGKRTGSGHLVWTQVVIIGLATVTFGTFETSAAQKWCSIVAACLACVPT